MSLLLSLSLLLGANSAHAACTSYDNAILYVSGEPVTGQTMVVDGGVIVSIISLGEASADCARVDLQGAHITPGFMEVGSVLGLVEIGLESKTVDYIGGDDDFNRAAFVVGEAYNPRSSLVPITRAGGVTHAVVMPSGGLIAGQSSLVRLVGATQADTVIDWSAAMHAELGLGGSRATGLNRLRDLLAEAKQLDTAPSTWQRERLHKTDSSRADVEALIPVIRGTLPLVVTASRASDIEALLRLIAPYSIALVIRGGEEAWLHADALAAANVGVIVDPMSNGAGGFGQRLGRADNAVILDAAGVTVALTTGESHNARNLRFAAGNAVRAGLSHGAALRAITSQPAGLFGHGELGDLVVGSPATFAVWSGDPFEPLTDLTMLVVDGTEASLRTRQGELFKRYRAN